MSCITILTNAVRGKQSNKSVKIFQTLALPYLQIEEEWVTFTSLTNKMYTIEKDKGSVKQKNAHQLADQQSTSEA